MISGIARLTAIARAWLALLRVAHALCDNITLKAEALWFDLGNVSLRATNLNFDGTLDVDQKVEGVIARAGVGYKF